MDVADDFSLYWQSEFPAFPPMSHLLKWELPNRWLRIHSLPNSKRFPETEQENEELLRRQNSVLEDVFGERGQCFIVAGQDWEYSGEDFRACPDFTEMFRFSSLPPLDIAKYDPDTIEDWTHLQVAVSSFTFQRSSLDKVLLCVADERLFSLMVVDTKNDRIAAPYDGGIDIILQDENERDSFRLRYQNWLSDRPDGL